ASASSGPERTQRMEVIVSKMRSLALSVEPPIAELAASSSSGERLAAVAALQAVPDAAMASWLAGRLSEEAPFVGYHAVLALLYAAHSVDAAELPLVAGALDSIDRAVAPAGSDRQRALASARAAVAARSAPRRR